VVTKIRLRGWHHYYNDQNNNNTYDWITIKHKPVQVPAEKDKNLLVIIVGIYSIQGYLLILTYTNYWLFLITYYGVILRINYYHQILTLFISHPNVLCLNIFTTKFSLEPLHSFVLIITTIVYCMVFLPNK